jgi:adenylate cyclase
MTAGVSVPPPSQEQSEYWRQILTGEQAGLKAYERIFRTLPSPPRCKLCQAPFKGPFAPVLRLLGFRRWRLNQQLCRWCISSLETHHGGAEIPVSLLFADVRGSTVLAERMAPAEFSRALDRFYSVVTGAIDAEHGVIDHLAGDGVMAMWIPGFVGAHHPQRCVAAGRHLATDLKREGASGLGFPAGVGVHTGVAYVGVVGEGGSLDFTVLGDAANTVARLGSSAAGGELVMSDVIVKAAGVDTAGLEARTLELKGKSEPFAAWAAP